MFIEKLLALTAFVLFCTDCEIPDFQDFIDRNLQGQIQSYYFVYKSGYATTNVFDISSWSIRLYDVDPSPGLEPWEAGAYNGYPYLSFTIVKDSLPQTYAITTWGTPDNGHEGKLVTAWQTLTSGVGFDGGELEITDINMSERKISGRIWATTYEKTSSLNGNFTVVIDPSSL